jgi:WD40 repeat protein
VPQPLPPAVAAAGLQQFAWPLQAAWQFGVDRQQRLWRWAAGANPGVIMAALNLSAPVQQLIVSDDGKTIAVLTTTGQVQFWEEQAGKLVPLATTLSAVTSLRFLPQSSDFVVADRRRRVVEYNLAVELQATVVMDAQTVVRSLDVNRDGTVIVGIGDDHQGQIWVRQNSTNNYGLEKQFKLPQAAANQTFNRVAMSADSTYVAIGRSDGQIIIADRAGNQRALLLGHQAPLHSLAFNTNTTQLLSASTDRSVQLWDLAAVMKQSPQSPTQVCQILKPYLESAPDLATTDRRLCDAD